MRLVILLIAFISHSVFADLDVSKHVEDTTKSYKSLAQKLVDQSNLNIEGREKNIEKLEKYINSEQFMARQVELSERIGNSLGIDFEKPQSEKTNDNRVLPKGHSALLYVSSSMPKEVIHRYALDLHKIQGTILIRGPIGGISKMQPTSRFIRDVTKRDLNCTDTATKECERLNIAIRIDPKRFSENNISQVPALTFETNYSGDFYCNTGQPKKNSHVIYGDAALKGLLVALYDISEESALKLPIDILRGTVRKEDKKSCRKAFKRVT